MAVSRLLSDVANALVGAAKDEDVVHRVVNDLKEVVTQDRATWTKAAQKGELHPYVQHAMLMLLEHDMLDELPRFLTLVLGAAQTNADHRNVRVTSPIELTDDERKQVAKLITKKFGGTHTLEERIDPSLLGGLVISIADWHVDASIKGKLARLTHTLTA
ncbi:MAG: ATP synthase F1 subunit delta [Patescibacteria group bacterium]